MSQKIIAIIGKSKLFPDCIKAVKNRFPIKEFANVEVFEQWETTEGVEMKKDISILLIENFHHNGYTTNDPEADLCRRFQSEGIKPVIIILDTDKHSQCEEKYMHQDIKNVEFTSRSDFMMKYKEELTRLIVLSARLAKNE